MTMNTPNEVLPLGWAIHPDRDGKGRIAKKQYYDAQVTHGLDRYKRKYNVLPKIAIMHPDTIKLEKVESTLAGIQIISREGVRKGDIFFCMDERDFVSRPGRP